jgi:transposase
VDTDSRLNVLLYGDEADIHLNPHLAYGWYLRGAKRIVPAPGVNQKRALYGAFNPRTGRLLVHTVRHKCAETFIDFLRCVLRAYPGKHVYLVLDNGPIHTAGAVLKFLDQRKRRLTVLWMPKYSPNLNLIERVWGHLKRSALANVFHRTVGRLVVAIARAVRAFNDRSNTMLRILFADYSPPSNARRRAA